MWLLDGKGAMHVYITMQVASLPCRWLLDSRGVGGRSAAGVLAHGGCSSVHQAWGWLKGAPSMGAAQGCTKGRGVELGRWILILSVLNFTLGFVSLARAVGANVMWYAQQIVAGRCDFVAH